MHTTDLETFIPQLVTRNTSSFPPVINHRIRRINNKCCPDHDKCPNLDCRKRLMVIKFRQQKHAAGTYILYQNPVLFGAGFQIISVLRRGTVRLNWYLGYPITRATSTRRLSGNPKRLLSCPLFSRAYIK